MSRSDVIAMARGYIGTPFHHQGRTPGVGLDCAGVLICVGRALGMVAPDFDVTGYVTTPDGRSLRGWCDRYMRRIPRDEKRAGDAIMIIVDADPQHLGILAPYRHGGFSIIHATRERGVVETRLMLEHGGVPNRTMRMVAAYAFPGL